jgi:uncharacterized protein (DUF302 family)
MLASFGNRGDVMGYYLSRELNVGFDAAVQRTIEALGKEGFGVLTDIDVQATLKKKLDTDVPSYRILGACNPTLAHRALQAESKLGVMLPCNVIVRDAGNGKIEVASVDPVSAMERIGNPQLAPVAAQVREKLQRALDNI